MKIIFTKHAVLKTEQRRLSREKVQNVLREPEFIRPSYGNREIAYRKIGKHYLSVIFKKEKNAIVVITAHWVAKPRR
ncbi:MAG: DUF4258 domain-containing protein [Patescibacteria group bacterium]